MPAEIPAALGQRRTDKRVKRATALEAVQTSLSNRWGRSSPAEGTEDNRVLFVKCFDGVVGRNQSIHVSREARWGGAYTQIDQHEFRNIFRRQNPLHHMWYRNRSVLLTDGL
jgi:hypothetical protein